MKRLFSPLLLSCTLVASETFFLDDITVTATKTQRKASDVPASVRVITQEEIQRSSAQSVDQLLQDLGAVDVIHNTGVLSSGSTSKVIIRGVGGTGESRVLLLVDGVPLNSALSGSVEWNQISLDAVERVELIKGANSALYGSNAMGGVVNIITKKGKDPQTNLSFDFGSMNTKKTSFWSAAKVDDFSYFLSGALTQSHGYITQLKDEIEKNTLATGIRRENWLAKLSYDIDASSTVSGSYSYYENAILGELELEDGYNPGVDTIEMTQISYSKDFQNDSKLIMTLFDKSQRSQNDYLKNATTREYYNSSRSDESGIMLQYSASYHNHSITAGFDFQAADVRTTNDYPKSKRAYSQGDQDYYALFLQDEIFIGEDIVLNIGGRFDKYKNKKGEIHDETTDTYTSYPSRSLDALSPKIAFLYRPFATTTVRSSFSQAFRAPSVNDLYKNTVKKDKISAGNPNLEPETITSFELGIDQQINDTAILSVTGYHSQIKDYIYSLVAPSDSPYYKEKINVGEARILGVETELRYQFSPVLSTFINYTYNKATIQKFKQDQTLEDKMIIRVPKNKASAGFSYKNPQVFDLKVNVRYVGQRYENDKNTLEYQSYVSTDLALSKNVNEQLRLSLLIQDLSNEGYEEKYVSPGRVLRAQLNLKF